jgi:hypothetical protein
MWTARRHFFLALLGAPLVCGWLFHFLPPAFLQGDGSNFLGYMPMGLSLFLTFVACNFTENDRRGRLDGFPSRLFTLPVPTRALVLAPIAFSALAVALVYLGWAKLALPALGKDLPLWWPVLYLGTGIILYQTIAWSLARFRITRLLVLGIGGTLLATSWLFLRSEAENIFFAGSTNGYSVRHLFCAALAAMSLAALIVANVVIEGQRRGGFRGFASWKFLNRENGSTNKRGQRTWSECLVDALPRGRRPFRSPARAQFWFEWRRHGILLPLATAGVLFLIVAPAPFCAPIGAESAGLLICWILALPVLLAFVVGKGFGKADLWSKEPGLPLFLATRPLDNTEWIGAKMKAAALATASSWLIVLTIAPLWFWLWCDWPSIVQQWKLAAGREHRVIVLSAVAIPILVLFTWRFLVGSLYIGLSGKGWMLNLAACGVFLAFFSPLIGAIPYVQQHVHHLLFPPRWFPWLLGGLLAAKIAAAAILTDRAHRRKYVNARAIGRYLVMWIGFAVILFLLVWPLIPFELIPPNSRWNKITFALLIFFAIPILRVSYAPIALARNRRS